jgi:hypothetical protein
MTITLANPVNVAIEKLKAEGYGLDAFDAAGARDRYGRALVKDPSDLAATISMKRPSSMAKMLDDMSGLVKWKSGRSALGVALNPTLADEIRQAITDPDDPDQKRYLHTLADEAADYAGAAEGRDYGSLVHALAEAALAGRDWRSFLGEWDDRELVEAAVDSLFDAIAEHGITVTHNEAPIVNSRCGAAGSTDGIGQVFDEELGKVVSRIFDIKCSKPSSLRLSWAPYGLQTTIYATGDCLYDPHTGGRTQFPDDFDRETAYIFHVDWRQGKTTIYQVDLRFFTWVLEELVPGVEEFRATAHTHVRTAPKGVPSVPRLDALGHRRLRVQELVDNGHRDLLLSNWPEGVSIAVGQPVSVDDLAKVDACLRAVEEKVGRWVDDDHVARLRKRGALLADDLALEYRRWWATTGWNDAHHFTWGQSVQVIEELDALEATALERSEAGVAALMLLTVGSDLAQAVRRTVCFDDSRPVASFTPLQLRLLEALTAAAHPEAHDYGNLGRGPVVTVHPDGSERLSFNVKALDGVKGLAKLGAAIAADFGWDKPKKADDVLADPRLASLVWHQEVGRG